MHFLKIGEVYLVAKKDPPFKAGFLGRSIKTCIGLYVLNNPQYYPFLTTRLPLGGKNSYFVLPFRQVCQRMPNCWLKAFKARHN
jgi:hypothetical protein